MDVIEQLEEIVPTLSAKVAEVRPDQFDAQTPCANFLVRDLFNHLLVAPFFAGQLRGDADAAPIDGAAVRDDRRQEAVMAALADLLVAVKSPGALARAVTLPFGVVPGEVLARFLTMDGMVHTWDLSRAAGLPYEPPTPLADQVLQTAHQLIAPEMRDGDTFAAETAPADSSALTRLVAFTGRRT